MRGLNEVREQITRRGEGRVVLAEGRTSAQVGWKMKAGPSSLTRTLATKEHVGNFIRDLIRDKPLTLARTFGPVLEPIPS